MSVSEKAREVYLEAVREIRDSVPKIIINIGIAVLIWVFTKYIFVPISLGYQFMGIPLPQLISLVMLVAVAVLVLGILREIFDIIDALAAYSAYELGARKGEVTDEELQNYKVGFRGIIYVIIIALLFLLFKDFLDVFHPVLSAIVLIVVVLWSVLMLLRSGRAFSRIVEEYANEWADKLEERAKSE